MTRVRIHAEPGGWWAEVPDLPGCYAAAATLDELGEALDDAVRDYRKHPTPTKE
jgi:predicted RNase H-like HicB family nuclease